VEEIVSDPLIDRGIERDSSLQRRMRPNQAHERSEAVIADTTGTNSAVAFGHMSHQPVDCVVCISAVINLRGIEWSNKGSERLNVQ